MIAKRISVRRGPLLLVMALVTLLFTSEILAHDLGLARIQLTQLSDQQVQLEAKLPTKLEPSSPEVKGDCKVSGPEQRIHDRLNKTLTWQIICPDHENDVRPVLLNWDREAALVVTDDGSGERNEVLLDANQGQIELHLDQLFTRKAQGLDLAIRYIGLGIEHILIGLDHLAFVLGLLLIASGWKLVKLVTAFTLGHSLSLTAAALGWVQVPIPPTEAVIALSVAFIAREAMIPKQDRRHEFMLVVLFGLLHGLGFASVLSEIGVSSGNLLLSIVSFNIGVEIGQLLFIAICLILVYPTNRIRAFDPVHGRVVTASILGSMAIFWTIDRVIAFA